MSTAAPPTSKSGRPRPVQWLLAVVLCPIVAWAAGLIAIDAVGWRASDVALFMVIATGSSLLAFAAAWRDRQRVILAATAGLSAIVLPYLLLVIWVGLLGGSFRE